MRHTLTTLFTGIALAALARAAWAEPAWTKTGDCRSCHTTTITGVLDVFGEDGTVDPDGGGPLSRLKVFRASPGQNKPLRVLVSGLQAADQYGVELAQIKNRGIANGILSYSADCDWAEWWSAKFYTDPGLSYTWGPGVTDFQYDITIGTLAAYDYYQLLFAVAGIEEATGELFYAEEPFYLQVVPAGSSPPTLVAAVSRKAHGGAGAFDIDLMPPGQQVAVEDRAAGPTTVIVTFSEPIRGVGGLDPSDVSLIGSGSSAGSVTAVAINGNQLAIDIAAVPDASRLTISFPGIEGMQANRVADVLCLGVLAGDVNQDGVTNILDLVSIRNALNTAVDVTNFRADANTDGGIDVLDLVLVRNNLNANVSGPCP